MRAKKMKVIGRIVLFLTAICMLAIIFTSLDVAEITADAASLPHIEEILASRGTYHILEIVPDAAAASFGYYVNGQEPIAGWKNELAAIGSPAERITYVNGMFSRLVAAGLMSDSAATPLTYTYGSAGSYYSEQYEVTDPETWIKIPLDHSETAVVTGVFSEMQNGAYTANSAYILEDMGGYVQKISQFVYTPQPVYGGADYYYNPAFVPITIETDIDLLITQIGNFAVYTKDEAGNYIFMQKIQQLDGLNIDVEYFYADPNATGAPGGQDSGCFYKAIVDLSDDGDSPGDGFVATAGASYFSRDIVSYTYVGQGGAYSFSPTGTETHDVYYNNIYFKGGFTNNHWFKTNVFGLDASKFDVIDIDIVVTVKEAKSVTASDIADAEMIYLSAGSNVINAGAVTSYSAANDLADNEGQAVQIYKKAAGETPVIVDYSIVQGITSSTPAAQIGVMKKLVLLCLQSELAATEETSLSALTVDWLKLAYISNDIDKSFVNNNIFCFDAMNTQSTSEAPNINYLVSRNFGAVFNIPVYTDGFSAVLAEIEAENLLKQIAKEPLLSTDVTLSAAVRHIINFSGRRQTVQKDRIKVLDLQPAKVTSASWLKPETVRTWINDSISLANIEIVHMTTGEFIGKIENINETYDLVYIGMSTESLNTYNGSTAYNDYNMNGLVYTNIGDTYNASIELAGIREQDYVYQNGVKAIDNTNDAFADYFRFSGNDITEAKVKELKQFVEAGYPVVLADGFVTDSAINTGKVDNSSYMYEAVSNVYGLYPNVLKQSDATAFDDTVIKYLNVSKPEIVLTAKPIDYKNNTTYLAPKSDGYYYLEYRYQIENVTDATPISTTYNCRLYVDLNADGRYSSGEELNGIEIVRVSDNKQILPEAGENGKESYRLYAGIEYTVSRAMAEDYVGIIPWKLEVVKNGADHIHASAQGYTRIAAAGNVEQLKILQIMKNGSSGTLLNLASQLTVDTGTGTKNPQLLGDDSKYYKGIYGKLIADLDDFNVTIETMEASTLETKGTEEEIYSLLTANYDMLIIGFADCFGEMGPKGAAAVVSYIESGRSVLFTHDTTSPTNVPSGTQMATAENAPATDNLLDPEVVYNPATAVYQSANSNINWQDSDYSTVVPPNITEDATDANPVYVVFLKRSNSYPTEKEYYDQKAAIYKVTGNGTKYAPVTQYTSSYTEFRNNYGSSTVIYVYFNSVSGWYGLGDYAGNYNITTTSVFTKFVSSTKYICTGITYKYSAGSKPTRDSRYDDITSYSPFTYNSALYGWMQRTIMNGIVSSYRVVGTYNTAANTYTIDGQLRYPATGTPFLQRTLYVSDPVNKTYTLTNMPTAISDWGYYFNTIIRDAVGLDRYGVTNASLRSIVDSADSLTQPEIQTVLNNNRSVAYAPGSSRLTTVDEYQGYTNYALIRFAGSGNTFKYTNNIYTNRETTKVSQVNQGQITTYPYNVNTAAFGGTTGNGGSYMDIGLTHEQYYQINMNTDDIVVWYCLSSGGADNNSYYDDVPNDVVNAYYIYNKGNVTYSGVGHTSAIKHYTGFGSAGSGIEAQYINEAKLFVNTMIAAYQASSQKPTISVTKTQDGEDPGVVYITADDTTLLESEFAINDEKRAIYFRINDISVEENRTIYAEYYFADPNGVRDDYLGDNVTLINVSTYNTNNAVTTVIQGGFVYKFYLPNEVFNVLADESVNSLKLYIKASMTIGSGSSERTPTDSAVVEIKKVELFDLT